MLKLLLLTDLLTRRLWPSVYVLVSDLGDNGNNKKKKKKLKKRKQKQPNKSNSRLDWIDNDVEHTQCQAADTVGCRLSPVRTVSLRNATPATAAGHINFRPTTSTLSTSPLSGRQVQPTP